jgi:hypothetical protein
MTYLAGQPRRAVSRGDALLRPNRRPDHQPCRRESPDHLSLSGRLAALSRREDADQSRRRNPGVILVPRGGRGDLGLLLDAQSHPPDCGAPCRGELAACDRRDDRLVKVAPLPGMIPDWRRFLNSELSEKELRELREHSRTVRPLGSDSFLDRLEGVVGRILRPQKGGRPSKLRKLP